MVTLAVGFLCTPAALAQAVTPPAFLPYSWLEYCATAPGAQCAVGSVTAEDVATVNTVVNRAIAPLDVAPEGFTAFPPSRTGKCWDYAVTKRATLLALGLPASAMTLVHGRAMRNGKEVAHVVLEVNIDGLVWVLDNLVADGIYAPAARPYPWIETARQDPARVVWRLAR